MKRREVNDKDERNSNDADSEGRKLFRVIKETREGRKDLKSCIVMAIGARERLS